MYYFDCSQLLLDIEGVEKARVSGRGAVFVARHHVFVHAHGPRRRQAVAVYFNDKQHDVSLRRSHGGPPPS